MTNEVLWKYAASVPITTSGASIASAAFAAGSSGMASAQHSNYPYADFTLFVSGLGASTASAGNGYVALYQIRQNAEGNSSADGVTASTAYRGGFVGSFQIPNSQASTTTCYIPLENVPLSQDAVYVIENQAGQSMNAGWALTCTPKSWVPSA